LVTDLALDMVLDKVVGTAADKAVGMENLAGKAPAFAMTVETSKADKTEAGCHQNQEIPDSRAMGMMAAANRTVSEIRASQLGRNYWDATTPNGRHRRLLATSAVAN